MDALVGTGGEPPFGPEEPTENLPHRPAHERDRKGDVLFSTEAAALPDPDEFEIETTARDNLLPPSGPLGTSPGENLPGLSLSKTPPADDKTSDWGNISLGSEPNRGAENEDIFLTDGAKSPPPIQGNIPDAAAPPLEPLPNPAAPAATASRPRAVSEKKGRKNLVILLVLAILGVGGYFAYPMVMKIINDQGVQPEGTLTPGKIQVRSLTRQDGKVIFTVRGEVRNNSATSVGMIQIEAQFRSGAGDIVAKANSFCGNIFEDDPIITGDMDKIRTDLQNELGQSLSNSNIRPGQTVPFLVVLENPPAGINKVTVTISGFKETT